MSAGSRAAVAACQATLIYQLVTWFCQQQQQRQMHFMFYLQNFPRICPAPTPLCPAAVLSRPRNVPLSYGAAAVAGAASFTRCSRLPLFSIFAIIQLFIIQTNELSLPAVHTHSHAVSLSYCSLPLSPSPCMSVCELCVYCSRLCSVAAFISLDLRLYLFL